MDFSKNDLVGNSDPTTTTMLLIYHDRVAINTNRNIRKSLAQINSGEDVSFVKRMSPKILAKMSTELKYWY